MSLLNVKRMAAMASIMKEHHVDLCSNLMLADHDFVYNDYIEPQNYDHSDLVLGWPQGTATASAKDLAKNGVYGTYRKRKGTN